MLQLHDNTQLEDCIVLEEEEQQEGTKPNSLAKSKVISNSTVTMSKDASIYIKIWYYAMVIASFEFTVWFTSFVLQHLENILDFYETIKNWNGNDYFIVKYKPNRVTVWLGKTLLFDDII